MKAQPAGGPKSEPPARETEPSPKEEPPLAVVICDDHPAFANGLARLLEEEENRIEIVGVATSGREAEALVRDWLPDIVLTDIRMPGMDGIETTRRIRCASPTTKVMILTVSDEQADLFEALKAGASGYITKDKAVPEIVEAMRSVLKGNLVIPSDLAGRFMDDLQAADSTALSDEERTILAAIARGQTNRDMSLSLYLSERTINRRIEDIYQKLHITDRLEAVIYAAKKGIG